MGSLGRGGAVLAVSSGLVITVGMPADAIHGERAEPATAPLNPVTNAPAAPALAEGALAFRSPLISAPVTLVDGAALTAPITANVTFDAGAFAAVPLPKRVVRKSTGSTVAVTVGYRAATGTSVIAIAARYIGVPYLYGGTTPAGWDCSGATRYIFRQVGVYLPRTANEQMNYATRISKSQAKPGDLVFFTSGGRAYHVGIYAGNGMMYDAQRSGKTFTKREVYSATVVYGRVLD